uniref:Uncharacterized protein n=1 Tax=Schizaphis graminum TaxID=13262 RepID=A0A2S2PT46_SCHGA
MRNQGDSLCLHIGIIRIKKFSRVLYREGCFNPFYSTRDPLTRSVTKAFKKTKLTIGYACRYTCTIIVYVIFTTVEIVEGLYLILTSVIIYHDFMTHLQSISGNSDGRQRESDYTRPISMFKLRMY